MTKTSSFLSVQIFLHYMLFSSYLKEKAMKRSTERFETVSMVLLKYQQYKCWMKLSCWRVA